MRYWRQILRKKKGGCLNRYHLAYKTMSNQVDKAAEKMIQQAISRESYGKKMNQAIKKLHKTTFSLLENFVQKK